MRLIQKVADLPAHKSASQEALRLVQKVADLPAHKSASQEALRLIQKVADLPAHKGASQEALRLIQKVPRRARDERGFTLTELLITLVILGAIAVPLGNALIGFIRHTDDTTRRLSESHDIQIAAAYFAQDVQSVGARDWSAFPYPLRQSIEANAPAAGGLYPCGAPGLPAAVVRLAWDDPQSASATPPVVRVSYVVVTAGVERQLRRVVCSGSAIPVSDLVLAHNVDVVDPVLSCSSPCASAPAVPSSVTLTLSIRNPNSMGSAVSVDLTGQRRQT